MSWDTWTPPAVPTQSGASLTTTPRVNQTNIGDGNQDAADDGINLLEGQLTLTWAQVSASNWGSIVTFLELHCGIPFLYTIPGEGSPTQLAVIDWSVELSTPQWVQNARVRLEIDCAPG